jgi:hypothetical protein
MVARVETTSGHEIVKSETFAGHGEQNKAESGDQLPSRET